MILNDFVVLGRASPEPMRGDRFTVCCAGYSPTHGFIRLYPTKITSPLQQWNIIEVEVEKNDKDARVESWKIKGSKLEWNDLDKKIHVTGQLKREDRRSFIEKIPLTCPHILNIEHKSMGLVKPETLGYSIGFNANYDKEQQHLKDVFIKTSKDYDKQLHLNYICKDIKCSGHSQKLIEWGCTRWIDKNPDKPIEEVINNVQITNADFDKWLLVGNQQWHLNSFLVISLLRMKKQIFERKAFKGPTRYEVFKRDSFKCKFCGKTPDEAKLHIGHRIPVSKGGSNDLDNLITLCDKCNLSMGVNSLPLEDKGQTKL
jgi:hypothetical protein